MYIRDGRVIKEAAPGAPWPLNLLPGMHLLLSILTAVRAFISTLFGTSGRDTGLRGKGPRRRTGPWGGSGGGRGDGFGGGGGGGSGRRGNIAGMSNLPQAPASCCGGGGCGR